jgi:glucose-6-phosphate 1-dehydrogenase
LITGWQGVPFVRTGKRMQEKQSSIVIQFQPVPHSTFLWKGRHDANRLIINIQPAMDIRLQFMKKPGLSLSLKPAEMVLIIFLALPT